MKLNYFSSQTMPKSVGMKGETIPKITFSKNGMISINGPACSLMELSPGAKVSFCQDENIPENWYVFKDEVNGFVTRTAYDKKTKGVLLSHCILVRTVFESVGFDLNETKKFLVAGKPTVITGGKTKFWGILIK